MNRGFQRMAWYALVWALLSLGFLTMAGCEDAITLDNYNAVTTGMTQSQVEGILGGSGEEQVVAGVGISAGGFTSAAKTNPNEKTYVWKKDGKEISVTFRDGKVISKGKAGVY